MKTTALGLFLLLLITGCSHASPTPVTAATVAPSAAPREALPWLPFAPETFARAKAERKFVVLDGSAEWCHWCHVMEATTYHDPGVRAVLDKHFLAVKVDVDARPDLAERYGDYGWPATILFSPDADELGKYRGYIAPETFSEILREVVATGGATREAGADPGRTVGYVVGASRPQAKAPLPEETLAFIEHATDVELDEYWDDREGSWGRGQKVPLAWNNAWMLFRAEHGPDAKSARDKVLFTLDKQAKLIDPVWGGIYQYSTDGDWNHAHFEKLMTFQAPTLENYATAWRITKDPKHLARARAMLGYLDRFMRSPEGAFYTTQDADLNAHDRSRPFLDGHVYYALDEAGRLAKGLPRIDTHVYGRENGLAIAAYATLYEVTKDPPVRASAERAARRVLATHATKRGGIAHAETGGEEPKLLYLADNASFGLGLLRLAEATGDTEWIRPATRIADFMLTELLDEESGGLLASTTDPDAVGVFARRRVPFEENVAALRMLARLQRNAPDPRYKVAIGRILRAISQPEEIKARGRMLGDYLLALAETRGVR